MTDAPSNGKSDAYAVAGVDINSANLFVDKIKSMVGRTSRPEVLAGVGPFAGLFALQGSHRQPVLVASADGVGTKLKVAIAAGRFDTVGQDLVNHCVNDILALGAEPLFFLDYLASNGVGTDDRVALVEGMVRACEENGCALLGGETADMPDVYEAGDYDLAGFIIGMVEKDEIINGHGIQAGDVLLGLPSIGLHTNGYSLVRHIFGIGKGEPAAEAREKLNRYYEELGTTLGDALLRPHPSYLHQVRPALKYIKGIAHITGGGLIDNVPRILPDSVTAQFHWGSWPVLPIYNLIQRQGDVPQDDMLRTFNMGVGMVLVVSPENLVSVRSLVPGATPIGEIVPRENGPSVTIR
jgi:phosphoribosylformylglycinamidine cyclo-ligase